MAEEDEALAGVAAEELRRFGFIPLKAADVAGTGDYLEKIINLIRGCGFGVAVFSPYTPAPTLGNIFFEIGMCHVFGKPVLTLKTEEAKTPSDFVRTEWVSLRRGGEDRFRRDVRNALQAVEDAAGFFKRMADVALEAEQVDYELAFERYKQAVLIGGDEEAVRRIGHVQQALRADERGGQMEVSRLRLLEAVSQFLRLLPGSSARARRGRKP